MLKTKINTKVKAKVRLADRSNLEPTGVGIRSITLGAYKFEHKFIVCKHLLCGVISGLYFTQYFWVGIDWNDQGQLYLHQDHRPITYSRPSPSKEWENLLVQCSEDRVIRETEVILPPQKIAAVATKSSTITGTKEKFTNVMANLFLCITSPL